MKTLSSPVPASLGLLLGRLPLGYLFLFAGIHKLSNIPGFVQAASGGLPHALPAALGHAYLYCLPFLEILAGASLLLGLLSRLGAAVASFLLITIIIGATGIHDPNGGPFHVNVAYLGLALLLLFTGTGLLSLDTVFFPAKRRSTPASSV